MRKISKLLLIVVLASCTLNLWSQVSTEGREFWVALNMTTGTGGSDHEPFICITTQHPGGSYEITNPADASFTPIKGLIPPTGYIKIQANVNPSANQIDLNKWYPVGMTAQTASNQVKNVGLKITTTVDCSVYAGNRMPQSFDAANILPIDALQTEYITQDYPGFDHEDKGGGYPVNTILATKDNTKVTIIPSSNVLNSSGTATITKTLNEGQVLYITGENRKSLSGTTITSNEPIAVFSGVNNTDVPGPVSARDHLYEQNMPIEYWGTHFVVTRSMKKDANRIRVTAKENGTQLFLDGSSNPIATINTGETYEFELCSAVMRTEDGYTKAVAEGRGTEYFLEGYAHYLETSCPCAVYSYDVSENYYIKKNGTSERDPNAAGDPAMVWISPLEQQLNKVTFGVMNTDKTTTHYVNIITPTNGASSLEVREVAMNAGKVVYGNNLVQPSDVIPVPSNTAYSYARIKLTDNKESVYTITSDIGFIAHVYGSGDKESYAYSAGSAAVEQGVKVNGDTYTNGYRSDKKYCFGEVITFDANVGTDQISRVDWNFGDGTTLSYGPSTTTHTYTSPGWYDVTADLYGHQVCTPASEQSLGSVSFSFRIVRPDTVFGDIVPKCISLADYKANPTAWDDSIAHPRIDTVQEHCYDTVFLNYVIYNRETEEEKATLTGQDSVKGYNGKVYYASQDVEDTVTNAAGCNHFIRYSVKVVTCLDMSVKNNPAQYACPGENFSITYTKKKGDIDGKATLKIPGYDDQEIDIPNTNVTDASLTIPVASITRPGIYKAKLLVKDLNCGDTKSFDIDFRIYYPKNIFAYKFNNVLAVYQKGYGGNSGFDFVAYQWYLNGVAIPGATNSIYHTDEPFSIGDFYSVELTDQNGMTLQSCSQEISTTPDYKPQPSAAPATKKVINNCIYIIVDERMYDAYGTRVQ